MFLAAPAGAVTIVQTDNDMTQHGMAKFDVTLGVLNSVTLKIKVNKSNYNQLYSTTAATGNYAVSWTSNGLWTLSNAATGNLSIALTGSGSTTVNVVRATNFVYGYFSIYDVIGSQTFDLNPANFNGVGYILLDGKYLGAHLVDASDTTFVLPPDFAVRRVNGGCGGGGTPGDDLCGTASYTLTYDYTPWAAFGVPEPATWAMMLLGFGAMGAAMRRRPAKVSFA